MFDVTFNKSCDRTDKEYFEWVRLWCDNTNDSSLPRVALIGDSITEGYYKAVQSKLKGTAFVDYIATSYSINSNIYQAIVRSFVADSNYAAIHFNFGLHDYKLNAETFAEKYEETIKYLSNDAPVVISTVTNVLDGALENETEQWRDKIIERNTAIRSIAENNGYALDDLNAVCKKLDKTDRSTDGVHYVSSGYDKLADEVVKQLKFALKK